MWERKEVIKEGKPKETYRVAKFGHYLSKGTFLACERKEATYACKILSTFLKKKKVCERLEVIKVSERIGSYKSV